MLKVIAALTLATVLLAGCLPSKAGMEVRRPDAGELLVYLQALPPEAARLRFTIVAAMAVREDGTTLPLNLALPEPTGGETWRQRLFANGWIPEGSYRGLALTIGRARLKTEDGFADLLVPELPVSVEIPFRLPLQGAALLEIVYRHEGSVQGQFSFEPALFAHIPERPVVSLLAFVSDARAGLLTVFDRKSLQATGVVPVGTGAAGLAVDTRQGRLYAAVPGEDEVVVVDVPSGAVLGRIHLQRGDRPERLALTPDGRLLLSANPGSLTVSFLDPFSLVELDRVAVGEEPREVLLDRVGQQAFVFNLHSDSLSIIDLGRRQVVRTVATDPGPWRGAFSRDGSRLYVLHRDSPYLTVFDVASLTVRDRLQVGRGGGALVVDPRTDLLYLGREDTPRIDVFEPFSLLAVDFLETIGGVVDMAIDQEENRLVVISPGARGAAAIDLVSKRETGRLDAGPGLHSLVLMGSRR